MRRAPLPARTARASRAPAPASVATQDPSKDRAQAAEAIESAAGEEDPGASLGDPAMREAIRKESRAAGNDSAPRRPERKR